MSALYHQHSIVQATATSRAEYNRIRGWDVPENEDGADAGFIVKNLETGHVNWYPNEVFHASFSLIADAEVENHLRPALDDTEAMLAGRSQAGPDNTYAVPFVVRMRAELAELEGRLAKLTKYLDSDQSRNLPFDDLNLLRAQRMAMEGYKEILNRRLRRASGVH